jgi:hypothetical protein
MRADQPALPTDPKNSKSARRAGQIFWPSYLAASAASVLLFAFIDPLVLTHEWFPNQLLSREFGYAIGFFFLWGATALSAYLALLLANNGPSK